MSKNGLGFLKDFKKKMEKMPNVSTEAKPPTFWISTGNYVINKIVSGKFERGIGQGRLASLAGPSGAGKSFVAGNIIRSAQEQGCGIFIVDSENALDDEYMSAIGVDVDREDYIYSGCNTISEANSLLANFIKNYRASGSEHKFLIVVDSLDMLMTDSDEKNYNKEILKGDQGQHAKQTKKLLGQYVHSIKDINVAMLCTKQVYAEQDNIQAMRFPWKFTESLKYAFSQIFVITRLLLKDDNTKTFEGIKLQVFGFKTRFTKPYQKCEIEVPYDTGMDPYSGLLMASVAMGVVNVPSKGWYSYKSDKKWREDALMEAHKDDILKDLIAVESEMELNAESEEYELDLSDASNSSSTAKKRRTKASDNDE